MARVLANYSSVCYEQPVNELTEANPLNFNLERSEKGFLCDLLCDLLPHLALITKNRALVLCGKTFNSFKMLGQNNNYFYIWSLCLEEKEKDDELKLLAQ